MRTLTILICGSDEPAMRRIADSLSGEGVKVATSTQPVDSLVSNEQDWDCLLVDLDGLNSFLRSLLPSMSNYFPNLPMVGISTKSSPAETLDQGRGLKLDACLNRLPRPEDLIVSFPQVAAKYLCDTSPLA